MPDNNNQKVATICGFLSIIFWSTTFAFSKDLADNIGKLQSAAYIYLLSGLISCGFAFSTAGLNQMMQNSKKYLFICGGLFMIYAIFLYVAIGLSKNTQQLLEVSVINYLWPCFTMALSVPILGKKYKWWLIPGVLLALAGTILAVVSGKKDFSILILKKNLMENYIIYIFAFLAALSWSVYSNLCRKWGNDGEIGAVPIFILVTGLVILLISFAFPCQQNWSQPTVYKLFYMSVIVTFLAYVFWDFSMRRGKIITVISVSYFIPLFSAIITCLYYEEVPSTYFWIGCGLVITGAVLSKTAIKD